MFEKWISLRGETMESPYTQLEQEFLIEFFKNGDVHVDEIHQMSSEEAAELMAKACRYASLKLAAVESAKRFKDAIRKD